MNKTYPHNPMTGGMHYNLMHSQIDKTSIFWRSFTKARSKTEMSLERRKKTLQHREIMALVCNRNGIKATVQVEVNYSSTSGDYGFGLQSQGHQSHFPSGGELCAWNFEIVWSMVASSDFWGSSSGRFLPLALGWRYFLGLSLLTKAVGNHLLVWIFLRFKRFSRL